MIKMAGSYIGNRRDGKEAIDFFARGLIKVPFKVVPLSELGSVFKLMGMKFFLSPIYSLSRSPLFFSTFQTLFSSNFCPPFPYLNEERPIADPYFFFCQKNAEERKVVGRYVLKMPE